MSEPKATLKPIEQFLLPMAEQPKKADPRGGWTSASNADADQLCQGRHQAQKGLPELEREEGWDEFGNSIHEALKTRKPDALTEQALQVYERCLEIEGKAVAQFFGEESADLMTIAEERYWVKIDKKYQHSGQCDRIYRSKTKALILDYKTLPGDVPSASSNRQLRDLVCLVNGNLMAANIGAVLVQPMVTMSPELCVYGPAQIKQAIVEMFDRVRASHDPNAKRTAGVVQCKYCKAKGVCKEYAEFAAGQMPVMQSFVDSPVELWTPEQCDVFLNRMGAAEQWLKETKARVKKRIEAGEIPGWKIGQGDRMFEVTDMKVLAERCATLGIPNEELIEVCSPGKAELTRLIRNKLELKGKALDSKVNELFSGIVADKRKAGSIEKIKD